MNPAGDESEQLELLALREELDVVPLAGVNLLDPLPEVKLAGAIEDEGPQGESSRVAEPNLVR